MRIAWDSKKSRSPMEEKNLPESDSLRQEVEVLRQLVFLARGPIDPVFRRMDAAIHGSNIRKLRAAKDAFDRLSEQERYFVLGGAIGDGDLVCASD